MLTKQIHKIRQLGEITFLQAYNYSIQDKYLKWKKNDKMHKYLRESFLKSTPKAFLTTGENVASASSSTEFHAVNEDGELFYSIRKELDSKPFRVRRYTNGTHDFSKWIQDSLSYINKDLAKKIPVEPLKIMPNGMDCHENIQKYLMLNGLAEAVEVPAWRDSEENPLIFLTPGKENFIFQKKLLTTCFIDALFFYRGFWWIFDYKPQASSAKNKYAVSQLLINLDLLSIRTGVPTERFKLAYGDEKDTFELVF